MSETIEKDCEDLTLTIPCELADRVRRYSREAGIDLNAIMVEALDAFLRGSQR